MQFVPGGGKVACGERFHYIYRVRIRGYPGV